MEVAGVVIGSTMLAAGVIGGLCARQAEKKEWNRGVCPSCRVALWESFDMDSSGARGYKCANCGNHCWISYNVDK